MIIHRRVVDDLIGDPQALAGVVLAGFVRHGDGAFNAPAKAEGFGEAHTEAAMAELVAVFADGPDQTALIGLFKASSHFFGTPESASVVTVGMMQGALEGVGIHGRGGSPVTLWAIGHGRLHGTTRAGHCP